MKKFWEWCRETSKHSTVFVSEYIAPEDFHVHLSIEGVKSSLSANGKHGKSLESIEKVFSLVPPITSKNHQYHQIF